MISCSQCRRIEAKIDQLADRVNALTDRTAYLGGQLEVLIGAIWIASLIITAIIIAEYLR